MRNMLRGVVGLMAGGILAGPAAGSEFRGVWVDAFHPGFKNHEQVTQMVNWAKATNFNALFVEVRKRGDAYYNSHLEPKATDIATDYDPLADVIQQAHAAGLEVHAWLSVYDIMHDSKWYKPGPTHIYRAHPDWLMTMRDGWKVFEEGKIFVDPGVPAVQDHIVAVVLDIVNNYQVDGINLDNVRYPGRQGGYNPTSVAIFNRESGRTGLPDQNDPTWCQWRREQVTNLVRKLQQAVNASKPEVKLSASVLIGYPQAAAKLFLQEWGTWSRDRLVDFLVPMIFMTPTNPHMPQAAAEALKSSCDRHVYIGIGGWRLPTQVATDQINHVRAAGGNGVVLFSYHYLGPNSNNTPCVKGEGLVSSVFAEPTSVPPMPWRQ